MKNLSLLVSGFAFSLSVHLSAAESVKLIDEISHREMARLPPELRVTFDIHCNQTFLRVIREDIVEAATGNVLIHVAALVSEDSENKCNEPAKRKEYPAGTTFSGREYEIKTIKK